MSDVTIKDAGELFRQRWPEVVAKAWLDPAFKAKLLADPAAVLTAEGLPMIDGVAVEVVEGGQAPSLRLPLPPVPADVEAEDLQAMIDTGLVVSECAATSCCC